MLHAANVSCTHSHARSFEYQDLERSLELDTLRYCIIFGIALEQRPNEA